MVDGRICCRNFICILLYQCFSHFKRGWSGCAMVLGKLPVPGRPTIWIRVGQGPAVLAVGASGGCLDIFSLVYHFSFLSPSLWETDRYLDDSRARAYCACSRCGWGLFGHFFSHLSLLSSFSLSLGDGPI